MHKRFLCLLCLCLLLFNSCAGQPVEIPPAENTGRRAETPDRAGPPSSYFTLDVAGKSLQMPLTLPALRELGFQPEEPLENALEPDEFSDSIIFRGNGISFLGVLYNPFNQTQAEANCPLVYISVQEQVTLENGLGIGSTQEEILSAYGSAEEGFLTDDSQWLIYGTGFTYALCFEIDLKTGRVITVDSYGIPLQEYEAEP